MTQLSAEQGITRFKQNEERVDNFVNGSGYIPSGGGFVPGLPGKMAELIYNISAFNSRGNWAASTVYAVKDLVLNSGTWYVAVTAHTSSSDFSTDMLKWRVYQGVTTGDLSAYGGSGLVGFKQSAAEAVLLTVQDQLRRIVSLSQFGVLYDGTDESVKVQKALDYCATFPKWPALKVEGEVYAYNLKIDREVNTTLSDFRIYGVGPGAGFITKGHQTIFDSNLALHDGGPSSEFIVFDGLEFRTDWIGNNSYILSKKFLRIRFEGCRFFMIRCQQSDTFAQTLHFSGCNIRGTAVNFIDVAGLYDVSFSNKCVIENGSTLVRSIHASRGCSGLRIIDNLIEGLSASIVVATGLDAFNFSGNHIESNFSPEINSFAGSIHNKTVTFIGNFINNVNGATFYHGPTDRVVSYGNSATTSLIHSNVDAIGRFNSAGDLSPGGVHDSTDYTEIGGFISSGISTRNWTDTDHQFEKNADGEIGIGISPQAGTRFFVFGSGTTSATFAAQYTDALGRTILSARDDRQVWAPAIGSAAGTALVLDSGGFIKTLSSSKRYKQNINPIDVGLNFINSLNPVSFDLKETGEAQVGFIAEDFPDVRFVTYSLKDRSDPNSQRQIESVNYGHIVAPLVKAIQELSAKFEEYKAAHP